ncbi:alpha/beta hydrolase [Pseudodonghicola flavimaris]|uniref:Alpha/beta hydrolase n=1 Tax=Pseudodonghicola flavimaris TaxID=3050036 RepID=A0ABT7F3Y2_9RHOB|nr:alpha/beta hydrolase [Pseudodonghicola flavimaris]MDK3019313.1 alpha/beta hydrolase [Pseudodonghicola flavimaris]
MPPLSRLLLPLLCVGLWLTACGRAPEMIGVDDRRDPALSVPEVTRHKVFITTTRAPSPARGVFFSGKRASELALASVEVTVPPDHVAGEVERPHRLPPKPRHQFAVVDPQVYGAETEFLRAINAELARRPPEDRNILFFIHGYNITMTDAVLRVGQFVQDSGFTGVPVVFSWASAGRRTHYVYDINSTLAARPLVEEASNILSRSTANGFDVFAHSMGGFLLMEVMVQSALADTLDQTGKLNNIMLAAPDIDLDVFRTQLGQIDSKRGNLYVLVSQDDFALRLSRRVSGGVMRLGAADAMTLEGLGVSVIDLSRIHDSDSGTHRKFAGSPEVVQLIGRTLARHNYDRPPRTPGTLEVLEGVPVLRDLIPDGE